MAAVTPTTVKEFSVGDLKGILATFAGTLDNGDTWASGIPGIFALIPVVNDSVTTQASMGVGATWSGSTITINVGEDNTAVNLIVLARS
jgi:hypothetical protein